MWVAAKYTSVTDAEAFEALKLSETEGSYRRSRVRTRSPRDQLAPQLRASIVMI